MRIRLSRHDMAASKGRKTGQLKPLPPPISHITLQLVLTYGGGVGSGAAGRADRGGRDPCTGGFPSRTPSGPHKSRDPSQSSHTSWVTWQVFSLTQTQWVKRVRAYYEVTWTNGCPTTVTQMIISPTSGVPDDSDWSLYLHFLIFISPFR
jgi:hypothetical protein